MRSRASAWLVVVAMVAALGALVTPVGSWAAEPSPDDLCESAGLAGAEVSTSVRLEHDDHTYTKIVTDTTVDVPSTWSLAHDLLLSEDSRPYIEAMSCLMGSEQDEQRWSEWWTRKPVVKSKGDRVKVVHETYGWVDDHRGFTEVGLWWVRPVTPEEWTLKLVAPYALYGARWDEITVDPGSPGAERAEPEPRAGEGATALVWRPGRVEQKTGQVPEELDVNITIRPSWQRSWAAWRNHLVAEGLDFLGAVLWAATLAALLLTAVRRYRQRPGLPTDRQRRTLGNLKAWALAAAAIYALAAADGLTEQYLDYEGKDVVFGLQLAIEHGCALASVAVLLSFARPPGRVLWTAASMALVPLTVMVLVPAGTVSSTGTLSAWGKELFLEAAVAVHASVSICLVALLLLGFVAVAWRLASDGQLLPKSRRFPGRDRELRMRLAGPAVLAATVLMALCFALVEERNWQRASWLSDPVIGRYGKEHRQNFLWEAMWSVSYAEDWLVDHGWLLTSLAIVAALRTWHASAELSPLHDRADRLPLLVFFPLAVGLDVQNHLDNVLLEFLWIPLYMLTLYGATALLAHRSVLAQPFEISKQPLSTVAGPAARRRLLDKARSYREIHAELRRLDQGLFGDTPPKRDVLEGKLSRLHNWNVNSASGAAPDRLPTTVSVVDAALALGPKDDWWSNGVRAARFALVPGLPAAVLNTWAQWIRGEGWQNTLSDLLGFPSLVTTFVSWIATFAAAGFVLGTLWRVLPGRRGAVKAIPVAGAFALPVGLDVLVGWFTREDAANVALQVSTMLFVLTITAIALDLDTFAGERRYWQSRLGLLLSVYQMRYYSLQVAYLVGQIIAIISIWQFFAQPAAVPYQGDEPPNGN